MDRVFRLWKGARSERERNKYLFRLWELCRPEIKLALSDMAAEECSDRQSWLERRGLDFDEVCNAVFPAVKDAAHNFDPEHDSGASFSTFAMGYIRGAVASIAKDSPPLGNSHSREMERLNEDEVVQALPRSVAEIIESVCKHSGSEIVEAVYQKTKDAGEHPSEKLRRIANRIEEEFSEELEHSAKLQALHSMLIAQSIRAEDHESRMVLVSTLAHLLFIRQERRAKGMPPESYSVKALARVYGKPSPPTLAKWLKACDEQGITAENCTVEEIARIISSKRGPAFRGSLNQ
jgi:hypothetical protein